MKLEDVNLIELQTNYLKKDSYVKGFCAGLTKYFRQCANGISNVLLWVDTFKLSDEILDAIAIELSVNWYDFNASHEVKAKVIESAISIHQFKGTKYALETAISDYFGTGYIKEWFEYSGEPFMFKIYTSSSSVTTNKVKEFYKIVEYCKNARSHLESIIIKCEIEKQAKCGMFINQKIKCTIGGG